MTVRFNIPYPSTKKGKTVWNREYGMNAIYAGKHWAKRKQDAEYWHAITRSAINRVHAGQKFQNPVVITFLWNDRLDLSNHAYMAKLIEDGMKGRLIEDDSRGWVVGIMHYFHDEPYIEVVVTDKIGGDDGR